MRLYSYRLEDQMLVGAERAGRLVSLPFRDMIELIAGGAEAIQVAQELIDKEPESLGFDQVKILAPIGRPGKIFCCGLNYFGHLEENPSATLLEDPRFFVKTSDAVIGPGQPIMLPTEPFQVDYEVELAVIIGRQTYRPRQSEVMANVFGYSIFHDVSARAIQFKDRNEDMGKNFDTFAPMGPCIVTKDEIPDPENLRLRLWLNGQLMQDGSNRDWCFSLPRVLSWLAMGITLQPGDIVTTGTPAGTGYFRKPPVFLRPGDVCRLEIDRIGVLENQVEAVSSGHSEWCLERAVGS